VFAPVSAQYNLLAMHHLNASGVRQLSTLQSGQLGGREPFQPCESLTVFGGLKERDQLRLSADGLVRPPLRPWIQDRAQPYVM
jgi:hypothetical protein